MPVTELQFAESAISMSGVNAMSIDVEDYFHVSAFAGNIDEAEWQSMPSRVEANVDSILQLLADADSKATFFVLGWVAERHPAVVRRIAAAGHEIGSHGMRHTRVSQLSRIDFENDVKQSKSMLEEIGGASVIGYRAPSYSIDESTLWAFEILGEAGYSYSSSIYPISHDLYGMPSAPRVPFWVGSPPVLEIPVSTVRLFNKNWPCGGGGYFRLFPYRLSRWAIRRVNGLDKSPVVFYFHPWEVDPEQPRISDASWRSRFRHYHNLAKMEARLKKLLSDFRWGTINSVFYSPASA